MDEKKQKLHTLKRHWDSMKIEIEKIKSRRKSENTIKHRSNINSLLNSEREIGYK